MAPLTQVKKDGITWPVTQAIVNADVNNSAAIAGSKIAPDFGSQSIDTTGNILLDSDSNKLKLGDGEDLEIFHNGTYSEIKNTTGGLYLENTGEIGLIKGTYASGEWMVKAVAD